MNQTLTIPPAADPALFYAQPDIEYHVYRTIKPLGAGLMVWSLFVMTGDPSAWIFQTWIQVDVRSHSKKAAYERADEARRAICALPWTPWDEGVVARVDVMEGPMWMPDQNNAPRYVARYAIYYHPQRGRLAGGEP